jgi:glyoxylase-like metal-dependent hydrolase (beta-lactamase superfamily II)
MTEVEPGTRIHRLQLPMPQLDYVNSYLVEGDKDNGHLLVDTGWDTEEAFDALKKQLAEIGINPEDISQILVTHVHPDHYGLAGKLKRLYNAKLALHNLEKDFIESRYINMDELLQQIERLLQANGTPSDESTELQRASLPLAKFVTPLLPDVTLHGNETIDTGYLSFKALWTPGHAWGHVCLYEPDKKILFSGDHILPTITPHIGLHPQSSTNPLGDYLDSLKSLKQLEVKLVLPGHGEPFTTFKSRIEDIIQHHQQRNSEILSALKVSPKTAYQIASEISWMNYTSGAGWEKLNSWNKRMAVLETLAHLEAMKIAGKLESSTHDNVIYYSILKVAVDK